MSRAKKCDRCGTFYEEGKREVHVTRNNGSFANPPRIDLCDECYKELVDWLEKENGNRDEQSWNTQDKD